MGVVLRLEIRRLVRSRGLGAALLVWVIAAAAAAVHGGAVVERQRLALTESDRLQAEQHDAVLRHQSSAPAGDQLYYLAYHTRHVPSSWAPLSLGQRDQRAFNLKVRMLALHGQLYDADLTSPLLAALGTFDFAFVLIALAPLVVIAVTHDVLSSEREAGTWPLIRSQPVAALRLLGLKLGVRVGVVTLVMLVVTLLAPLTAGAALDGRLLAVALVTLLYLALWGVLALVVATFDRSSEVNLLALLGVWLLWVVIGPALVTTAASARYPAPEALELTVQQREGYHGAWDRPVAETMARFYERYPEWARAGVPSDRYSNGWYYAMQQRGDDAAAPAAERYLATLDARHRWVQRSWWWLPPALVQAAFDRAARTDLPGHLGYLASVAGYHEQLKRHFFPIVFAEATTVRDVEWSAAPRHEYVDEGTAAPLFVAAAGVAAWCAALGLVATRRQLG
ncbi:MAG: DUF3526 domain-containing protein [Vicinamibacterales bacterium]